MNDGTHTSNGSRRSTSALIACILAVAMTMIDQTIVAICGPEIQDKLGISHDALQWTINGYILATAATFALGGKLADHYGHKRLGMIGIAAFGITSALCSAAPSGNAHLAEVWLIVARVLQGISGGLMFPAALGIVVSSFDRARRGSAMATFFAITGACTAVGPIAGGYLSQITWRSIFWINIPIAVVALLILATVPVPETARAGRVDWRGAGVIAVGMTLVILGLQQSSTWPLAVAIALAVVGVAVLVLAWRMSRSTDEPIVDFRRFASRGFTASSAAVTLTSFAFVPMLFFMSVYGQLSQGLKPEDSGIAMFTFFIGFIVASRVGAGIFDRRGAKLPIVVGGAMGAAGFFWWATKLTDLSIDGGAFVNDQLWPTLLAGAGVGFLLTPASTDGVNRGEESSYGEITGIFQTVRNFGAALGMAVMSALVTHQLANNIQGSIEKLAGGQHVPAGIGRCVADSIGGASRSCAGVPSGSSGSSGSIPSWLAADYAGAVQYAFYAMGAAMVLTAVIGLLVHPGDHTAAEPAGEPAAVAGQATG